MGRKRRRRRRRKGVQFLAIHWGGRNLSSRDAHSQWWWDKSSYYPPTLTCARAMGSSLVSLLSSFFFCFNPREKESFLLLLVVVIVILFCVWRTPFWKKKRIPNFAQGILVLIHWHLLAGRTRCYIQRWRWWWWRLECASFRLAFASYGGLGPSCSHQVQPVTTPAPHPLISSGGSGGTTTTSTTPSSKSTTNYQQSQTTQFSAMAMTRMNEPIQHQQHMNSAMNGLHSYHGQSPIEY